MCPPPPFFLSHSLGVITCNWCSPWDDPTNANPPLALSFDLKVPLPSTRLPILIIRNMLMKGSHGVRVTLSKPASNYSHMRCAACAHKQIFLTPPRAHATALTFGLLFKCGHFSFLHLIDNLYIITVKARFSWSVFICLSLGFFVFFFGLCSCWLICLSLCIISIPARPYGHGLDIQEHWFKQKKGKIGSYFSRVVPFSQFCFSLAVHFLKKSNLCSSKNM